MNMNKKAIAAAVAAVSMMAAGATYAAPVSTGGSFIMYNLAGYDTTGVMPGANLVNTDNTITGFVDQSAGTWGVASTTLFNFLPWTATNGHLVTSPGSYALDTATGNVVAGTGVVANDGMMNFNVGANQIAGTIDFAWGTNSGIRVVEVWDVNANGSLTASVVPGMENGPFGGFNAAFNLTGAGLVTAPSAVPAPAAVWLFGAGMIGLMGLVRRGRKTEAAGSLSA